MIFHSCPSLLCVFFLMKIVEHSSDEEKGKAHLSEHWIKANSCLSCGIRSFCKVFYSCSACHGASHKAYQIPYRVTIRPSNNMEDKDVGVRWLSLSMSRSATPFLTHASCTVLQHHCIQNICTIPGSIWSKGRKSELGFLLLRGGKRKLDWRWLSSSSLDK